MFLYNTFRWPWTRIAGLVAPRPMLFANSDKDPIFPMDANDRISNRLERLYSFYGAGDRFDTLVSVGGHAYRQDIRQGAFRFINAHLNGDARPIEDSEIDIVSEGNRPGAYPIPPEKLRVFQSDGDLPADQLNTKIDESFVPMAHAAAPRKGKLEEWKTSLVDELKRVSFGYFPETVPAAKSLGNADAVKTGERFQSEEGIEFRLRVAGDRDTPPPAKNVLLVILNEDEAGTSPEWLSRIETADRTVVYCEPRGIGETKWTTKNPPNHVARSHVLIGRTVDAGRVWDVIAAARHLATKGKSIDVAGKGAAGLIGAYAAVFAPQISEVTVIAPPHTHMDNAAPQFLNVLRVCDVPDSLGLIAPRRLTVLDVDPKHFVATLVAYLAAEAGGKLSIEGP
jgi:hypothetical protein